MGEVKLQDVLAKLSTLSNEELAAFVGGQTAQAAEPEQPKKKRGRPKKQTPAKPVEKPTVTHIKLEPNAPQEADLEYIRASSDHIDTDSDDGVEDLTQGAKVKTFVRPAGPVKSTGQNKFVTGGLINEHKEDVEIDKKLQQGWAANNYRRENRPPDKKVKINCMSCGKICITSPSFIFRQDGELSYRCNRCATKGAGN